MATKKPGAKDKIEIELKRLSKLTGNKTCVDCPEKIPNYVDTTHFTFVCTKCSGLHRELQYKVKGMGLSNFTEEELRSIEAMGNTKFNEAYLARYDNAPPNANDLPRFKEYLKQKYVDKRWYIDKDRLTKPESASVASSTAATLNMDNPLARKSQRGSVDQLGDSMKGKGFSISDNNSTNSPTSANFDPFGHNSTPSNSDPFAANNTNTASNLTFDAFGPSSAYPSQPTFNGFADFTQPTNNFTSPMPFIKVSAPQPAPVPTPHSQPVPEPVIKNFNAFDDLVTVAPPAATTAVNPFDQHVGSTAAPTHAQPPAQYVAAPPSYGGNPQHYGYPPQPNGGYGYPQPGPGYPYPGPTPPQYYQQYPPAPVPHGQPGQSPYYPGQQQNPYGSPNPYPGNPNQPLPYGYGAAMPPGQAPVQAKPAPVAAAPDPFSDMTGLAWNNLSKAPPPATVRASIISVPSSEALASESYSNVVPPPAAAPDAANPFDMFG